MPQYISPLALQVPYPDISTVRRFGNETEDFFKDFICPKFNLLMEGQKWIKERETTDGAFGYENLVLDPSLDIYNFVLDPAEPQQESTEDLPATQFSTQLTYTDIANLLGSQSAYSLADVMLMVEDSIEKMTLVLEELLGVKRGEVPNQAQLEQKVRELLEQVSYHNAFMLFNVGVAAHSEDVIENIDLLQSILDGIVDDVEDDDKREAYQEILDKLADFSAWLKELGFDSPGSVVYKAQKKLQFREAQIIAAHGGINGSMVSQHRVRAQRVQEENWEEKIEEWRLKKLGAARKGQSRQIKLNAQKEIAARGAAKNKQLNKKQEKRR